jgi:hypothetical protein
VFSCKATNFRIHSQVYVDPQQTCFEELPLNNLGKEQV